MKSKRTLLLLVATIATLLLAVIAVVTSMKLKELATVPVTPNAPVSKPKAAIPEEQELVCQLAMTVTAASCGDACATSADCDAGFFCDTGRSPAICAKQECTGETDACNCTGAVSCTAKQAFKDNSANKAGVYTLSEALAEDGNIGRDQTIVYKISYKNTKAAAVSGVTVSDSLPAEVSFVDAESGCSYTSSSHTVTCTVGSLAGNTTGSKAIRVKVKTSASEGTITNDAVVKVGTDSSTCGIDLVVDIPEPADPPECNDYCANDGECTDGMKCVGNRCRNPQCTSETDCVCQIQAGCDEVCSSDSDCAGGYFCDDDSSTCRNSQCPSESDCTCPTTTKTTTGTTTKTTPTSTSTPAPAAEEQLPVAGNSLPTAIFIGLGLLLLIGGVAAASIL